MSNEWVRNVKRLKNDERIDLKLVKSSLKSKEKNVFMKFCKSSKSNKSQSEEKSNLECSEHRLNENRNDRKAKHFLMKFQKSDYMLCFRRKNLSLSYPVCIKRLNLLLPRLLKFKITTCLSFERRLFMNKSLKNNENWNEQSKERVLWTNEFY